MHGPEVKTDSDHPMHASLYRTLVLLRLYARDGSPVYFIVEGLADISAGAVPDDAFYYDEHSCPTNYVRVEAIFTPKDSDPHGVFEYVRSVWMPAAYHEAEDDDGEAMLREIFPETLGGR